MPLIYCGFGGFHQICMEVEFKGLTFTLVGGASGTKNKINTLIINQELYENNNFMK